MDSKFFVDSIVIVSELAIEKFYKEVLCWFARLDN